MEVTLNTLRPVVNVFETVPGPKFYLHGLPGSQMHAFISLIHNFSFKSATNIPVNALAEVMLSVELAIYTYVSTLCSWTV